jgi:uncharacterized membrane protein YgdD (TMEM256/DUF423 family)
MKKNIVIAASLFGSTGVALGAMAAHYLKSKLATGLITQENLQTFDTASKYQLLHSIALLIIGITASNFSEKWIKGAANCLIIGILFFSGSLYILSTSKLIGLNNYKWLGPITPIGGLLLISGWILVLVAVIKFENKK